MNVLGKVKEIEDSIARVEGLISPLRQLEKELSEQIRGADESFAYTNKMTETNRDIVIYTSEKTIAEVSISSRALLKIIESSIEERTIGNKVMADKLKKIKEILSD